MRTPMPSPRGTNHEGLTIPGALAAYDAEPDDMPRTAELLNFLANKLEPDDLKTVKDMLGVEDDTSETGASDARRAYAQDARQLHRAGLINVHEYERRVRSGPPAVFTQGQQRDFDKTFPNNGRLK